MQDIQRVEKWDVFEVTLKGKSEGNPFTDYMIKGRFRGEQESLEVEGFYDGNGSYQVRFMPSYEGRYTYEIEGDFQNGETEQKKLRGEFEVFAAAGENHGPVRVRDTYYLGYEDGTPYYSIGTTCYAWVHQENRLQEQTLQTLKETAFNKIRFCIFPKYYPYNRKEPLTYPYVRGEGEGLDPRLCEMEEEKSAMRREPTETDTAFRYDYFNVEHFKRFDLRIRQLRDMGIEADIILMHPYDRWGMNRMGRECCELYVRYVAARFSAYRNVWWSLANEYDLISTKTVEDWERYAAILCEKDPYQHLRSIHNCARYYDHTRPWVTHCSLQRIDIYRSVEYTDRYLRKYQKPVVWDEISYEGNLEIGWGNTSPKELVRRFWEAFLRGGHAGHGETYLDENDVLWWSHGGILKGESAARLNFLANICKETPGHYLKHAEGMFDEIVGIAEKEEKAFGRRWLYDSEGCPYGAEEFGGREDMNTPCGYEIHYYGIGRPSSRTFFLPEESEYEIDVIDTWEMTVTSLGRRKGTTKVDLPAKEYMAIRLKRVDI